MEPRKFLNSKNIRSLGWPKIKLNEGLRER